MHLLHFKSWSSSWIPAEAHVEVGNLSPSPRVGCAQYFLFNGKQDDAWPGSKAGTWGKQQAKHRQPVPWSTRATVSMANNASLILAMEKEMQNVFKPSLKASWAGVRVCVRHILSPLGQLAFGTCQPFWKMMKLVKNIWCDESIQKCKKPQIWLNKSEIDHCGFPLVHNVNFLRHCCKNKLWVVPVLLF